MADLTAVKQNLEKTLASVGIHVNPGDDASLRAGALIMIQNLNLAFGDGTKPDQYTPETAQAIQDKLTEHFNTPISGVTRLEEFKAAVHKDTDFLAQNAEKPFWYRRGDDKFREAVKDELNGIYADNPNNISRAFFEIIKLSENEDTKNLVAKIANNTDLLTPDNIHASVALIENADTFFNNLGALNDNAFFDVAVDPRDLKKLSAAFTPQEEVAFVEKMIGIPNPDGQWGDAERAALKSYIGELQRHEYFGKGLSLEEKMALPHDLRTAYVHDNRLAPHIGDADDGWKPHNAGSELGPQAYDNEQDGIWDFGFKLHLEQRLTLLKGQYPEETAPEASEDADTDAAPQGKKNPGTRRLERRRARAARNEQQDTNAPSQEESTSSDAQTTEVSGITKDGYTRHAKFVGALIRMEARGIELLSEQDKLTPAEATRNVENALMVFAPMLNATLKDAQAKAEKAERLVNAYGVTEIFKDRADGIGAKDYFANFAAKDLLELRITEINTADTRFDFASQGALQGLMRVLSSEHVLGINSAQGEEFFYTPSKGNAIKTKLTDALKLPADQQPAFLQNMSAEQRADLQAMVESGQMDTLITSLNVLQKNGRILNYNIIDDKAVAPITQDIVKDEIRRLDAADNPDAVKLFDTLIYSYTNGQFGLNDVLDGNNLRAGEDETLLDRGLTPARDDEGHDENPDDDKLSAKQKYDQRLAQYFDATKNRLKGSDAENDAFFLAMLNSFQTLPFGNHKHREMFRSSMTNAFRNSENGEEFAEAVNKAMADIRERHGEVTLNGRHNVQPSVHPKLDYFGTITSGGESFDVYDIIDAYEDFHLGNATGEERERGQGIDVGRHIMLSFQDDDGKTFVAGIDKGSMVFTIEEVTPEQLQLMNRYLNDEKIDGEDMSMQERVAYLQKNSPAFALIYPDGYGALTTLAYKDFYRHISDKSGVGFGVRHFAETKERNASMANTVRKHAVTVDDTPLLASGTVRDAQKAARDFAAAVTENAEPQPPREDREDLIHFTGQIRGAAVILDDEKMELLARYNGRDDITIGNGQRHITRLKGVNIAQNPDNKPMVAYYNTTDKTIDVIPMSKNLEPHVTTHSDQRQTVPVWVIREELDYRRMHNIKPVFGDVAQQKPDTTAPKTGVSGEFEKSGDGRALPAPVETLDTDNEGVRSVFNNPNPAPVTPAETSTPENDVTPDVVKPL
jgi:hypothetical protein